MSNRLPSTRTSPVPSLIEVAAVEARIEALHGRLDPHPVHPTRYCVPSERAATTAERRALSVVAERLEADLATWQSREQVDTEVSRILLGFEQGRGRGEVEDEILVGEYVAALKGLPLAAIAAAAQRFRCGETRLPWNRRWRPSPAEFAAEVREGLIPDRLKLIHVRRILDAEVLKPRNAAEQAKVEEAAAAWLKEQARRDEPAAPEISAAEAEAAREASLREMGAAAARALDSHTAERLMGRLDARRGVPG